MRSSIVCVSHTKRKLKEKALKNQTVKVKENIKSNRNASQCNPRIFLYRFGEFFFSLATFFFLQQRGGRHKTTSMIRSAVWCYSSHPRFPKGIYDSLVASKVARLSFSYAEGGLDEEPQSRLGSKALRKSLYCFWLAGGAFLIIWTRLWSLTGHIRLGLDVGRAGRPETSQGQAAGSGWNRRTWEYHSDQGAYCSLASVDWSWC